MTNPEASGSPLFKTSAQVIKTTRAARGALGMSARALAERCAEAAFPHKSSLTRSRIAKLESASAQAVSVDELVLLSQALRIPVQNLLGITKAEDEGVPSAAEEAVGGAEYRPLPTSTSEDDVTPADRLTRLEQRLGAVVHALEAAGIEVGLPDADPVQKADSGSLPSRPFFQPPDYSGQSG